MFNPYESLSIGQDPRDIPPDMVHYQGDFVNYLPLDQLGVRRGDQLPRIDQAAIEYDTMQEADLLQRRIGEQAGALPAPLPSAAQRLGLPFTDDAFETWAASQPAPLAPKPLSPAAAEQPAYSRVITPEEEYCERVDRRKALARGGYICAAIVAATVIAASVSGSEDKAPTNDGPAAAAAPYTPGFNCRIQGVGENDDKTAFVNVADWYGREITDRNVMVMPPGDPATDISLAFNTKIFQAGTPFETVEMHNRELVVSVQNGNEWKACGRVALGKPGAGDEHVRG
jgi:hypothetical protein